MILSIIVAVASNGAIGRNNDLPWHLPGDLKRFKEITLGHPIIMGRNTYYSLPNGALPKRRNIVVSQTLKQLPDAECYRSLDDALQAVATEEEVFIIGGAKLFVSTIDRADRIYYTTVETVVEDADTFFPIFSQQDWQIASQEHYSQDDKNAFATTLTLYNRVSKN